MTHLDPKKLHVRSSAGGHSPPGIIPRRYTLTHSDRTGELFLTIGAEYDRKQISGLYTRLMRDEVLAEWRLDKAGPALHVLCHVSGGLVLGGAAWRASIFEHHMPQVLQAFRYGDRAHFSANPELDQAPVYVHFQARQQDLHRVTHWGVCGDFAFNVD
jgi:hypothetical protein